MPNEVAAKTVVFIEKFGQISSTFTASTQDTIILVTHENEVERPANDVYYW